MSTRNILDLLEKEIQDKYVQENFRRLREYLRCVGSGTQGPRGPAGAPGAPGADASEEISLIIPAGMTETIDTLTFSNFRRAYYKIELYSEADNVFQSFELMAGRSASDVDYSVYSILGDDIDKNSNISVVASDVVFTVTNNESFDLNFRAEKFI